MRNGDHVALQLRVIAGNISVKMPDRMRQGDGDGKACWTIKVDASAAREPQGGERVDSVGNKLSIERGVAEANRHFDHSVRLGCDRCSKETAHILQRLLYSTPSFWRE